MTNKFIKAAEVAQELEVSVPYAYKLIKKLNKELEEKGFITISGRVNRQYFYERLYNGSQNGNLEMVLSELKRIENGAEINAELLETIRLINTTLYGLKGECK